ncbi:MAG: hypothetical protein R3C03_07000 [Pirellulaceae bacterium]
MVPETGRLSVAVWLRNDASTPQPPVRISIESDDEHHDYYRFGSVGSLANDPQSNRIENGWKQFVVNFDDLPLTERTRLRVGIDLMGPGEIQLNRFELYDRWFDNDELKTLTQLIASTNLLLADPAMVDEARVILESYWVSFIDVYFRERPTSELARTPGQNEANTEYEANSLQPAPTTRDGFMFRRLRRNNVPDWIRQR